MTINSRLGVECARIKMWPRFELITEIYLLISNVTIYSKAMKCFTFMFIIKRKDDLWEDCLFTTQACFRFYWRCGHRAVYYLKFPQVSNLKIIRSKCYRCHQTESKCWRFGFYLPRFAHFYNWIRSSTVHELIQREAVGSSADTQIHFKGFSFCFVELSVFRRHQRIDKQRSTSFEDCELKKMIGQQFTVSMLYSLW